MSLQWRFSLAVCPAFQHRNCTMALWSVKFMLHTCTTKLLTPTPKNLKKKFSCLKFKDFTWGHIYSLPWPHEAASTGCLQIPEACELYSLCFREISFQSQQVASPSCAMSIVFRVTYIGHTSFCNRAPSPSVCWSSTIWTGQGISHRDSKWQLFWFPGRKPMGKMVPNTSSVMTMWMIKQTHAYNMFSLCTTFIKSN